MKLRELLKKLRLRSVQLEGERSVDNVDATASAIGPHEGPTGTGDIAGMAPPNWVPSQQDDRPRH